MTTTLATVTADNLAAVMPPAVTFVDMRRDPQRYPRIDAVPQAVALQALEKMVFRAFFANSSNQLRDTDAADRVTMISAELYDLLANDYEGIGTKLLSFAEIARVIRVASVTGQREMYGVSVAGLYKAIADYCLGEGRRASAQVRAERWERRPLPTAPAPAQKATPAEEAIARIAARHNLNK